MTIDRVEMKDGMGDARSSLGSHDFSPCNNWSFAYITDCSQGLPRSTQRFHLIWSETRVLGLIISFSWCLFLVLMDESFPTPPKPLVQSPWKFTWAYYRPVRKDWRSQSIQCLRWNICADVDFSHRIKERSGKPRPTQSFRHEYQDGNQTMLPEGRWKEKSSAEIKDHSSPFR